MALSVPRSFLWARIKKQHVQMKEIKRTFTLRCALLRWQKRFLRFSSAAQRSDAKCMCERLITEIGLWSFRTIISVTKFSCYTLATGIDTSRYAKDSYNEFFCLLKDMGFRFISRCVANKHLGYVLSEIMYMHLLLAAYRYTSQCVACMYSAYYVGFLLGTCCMTN